jgi:hypothetical protein
MIREKKKSGRVEKGKAEWTLWWCWQSHDDAVCCIDGTEAEAGRSRLWKEQKKKDLERAE